MDASAPAPSFMRNALAVGLAIAFLLTVSWVILGPGDAPGDEFDSSVGPSETEDEGPSEAELDLGATPPKQEQVATETGDRIELTGEEDLATPLESRVHVRVIGPSGEAVEGAEILMREVAVKPEDIGDPWSTLFGRYGGAFVDRFTDADGLAALPELKEDSGYVILGAQWRNLHGAVHLAHATVLSSKEPIDIQLKAAESMLVRVVGPDDQPVPEVLVYWWDSPTERDRTIARRETNAQGVAHFGALRKLRGAGEIENTSFGLEGAFVVRPQAAIGATELAQGSVELKLPETGAVRVRVKNEDGSTASHGAFVFLSFEADLPENEDLAWSAWQTVDGIETSVNDGVALLEPVEIGFSWQLAVLPSFFADAVVQEVGGPREAGEEVTVEVTVPTDPMQTHRLRVLDREGQPLKNYRVNHQVELEGESNSSSSSSGGSTDEEGYLSLSLINADKAEKWTISVRSGAGDPWAWEGSGRVEAELNRHDMPAEIRLVDPPIIVAGELVDPTGKPIRSRPEIELGSYDEASEFVPFEDPMQLATEASQFDYRALDLPPGPVVVRARHQGIGTWTEVVAAVGQTGVQIVLPESSYLRIKLTGIDAVTADTVEWRLALPEALTESEEYPGQHREFGREGEIHFGGRSLLSTTVAAPVGSLALVIRDRFGRSLEQYPIQVMPGFERDEPQEIVLNISLAIQQYRLRVLDASGALIPGASVFWRVSENRSTGEYLNTGETSYWSTSPPPTLSVRADEFEDQSVEWVGNPLVVTLIRTL